MIADLHSPSPLVGEGGVGGDFHERINCNPPSLTLPHKGGGDISRFSSRLRPNADLSRTNWFRVGGTAEWLFKPEDTEDLSAFLSLLPPEVPVRALGVGSNVIIRDGGVPGVIVKLGRGFTELSLVMGHGSWEIPMTHDSEPMTIQAGAAVLDLNVAAFACEHGLAGLEFLSGIPGTIGGGVAMNAGAYGSDMSRAAAAAEIVGRDGRVRVLGLEELGFSYRRSALPQGAIVTRAWLRAEPGDPEEIRRKMEEIAAARESTQPVRSRTGGSTFKNPPGHKAWELIDRSGCRGLVRGGAQVSEKHCNFLINTGGATAADLEALGEEVRRRVLEKTGVTLEWEIERIGNA